ncbi:glycosyltransferase family 4 protein [Microbacterium sp. MRS-1]|uniref:glycosyltransferase family 4 protein n=1 Tax=Microbacterium sp. MRS-1 TaxID=1451261 RepID=UPI0004520F85|nr:glycosyltransferase family 4 protein [Microbacterium sp. MRS-1]EXJ51340.1 hypothetical protein AS96_09990 [Microbacterium sp. MRS-1]
MTRRHTIAIAYDCLFPYTTGGGERQYRSFATWLAQRGNRVDYLTSRQWEGEPQPAAFRIVPIVGKLQLYDRDGVRRTSAALRYAAALFWALLGRRRQYEAVIVSGLPILNVFAARAALIGSGTKIVVDYLEVWGRRQWRDYAGAITGSVAWALQRAGIALTPIATAHSQLSARRLRAEGFRRRILVSPGLIDIDSPSTSSGTELSAAATPPFVLYAGRHIPDKRVDVLPAAVAKARETVSDLRLIILGDGPSSPDVDAAITASSAAEWTSRPGFVAQDVLDELMSSAAVLVNPSRREGYGLVVVEAAAHGTPTVLVADEGNASTELIDQGANGIVADSTDPADLGDAIVRAVSAGPKLRESTRAWYDTAIQTRTVEKTVDAILDAVRSSGSHRTDAPRPGARRNEGPQ